MSSYLFKEKKIKILKEKMILIFFLQLTET
jgi:hypothetical protein